MTCGNELLRFDPGYAYQPDPTTSYPPNCTRAGMPGQPRSDLPTGTTLYVVDNLAEAIPSVRPDCGRDSVGSFSLTTSSPAADIDVHQIGAGYGGHFWFTHMYPDTHRVSGTWSLGASLLDKWTRVLVHMPDHGAESQNARYDIDLGNGTIVTRSAMQETGQNAWVSLGVVQMAGAPTVTLTNQGVGLETDGVVNVAYDAVAFQVLPAKPTDFVVSLGDSYSSGEGAYSYLPETNVGGLRPALFTPGTFLDPSGTPLLQTDGNPARHNNACHRSTEAWPRGGQLRGNATSLGARSDAWDPTLEMAFLACSGAETDAVLSTARDVPNAFGAPNAGQYGMPTQLDAGYLDVNTTLVSLSIGGNDASFVPIVRECAAAVWTNCRGDLDAVVSENIRTAVADSVRQTLLAVRRDAPNAKIVVMGYPELWQRPAGTLVCGDWLAPLPTPEDMDWMDAMSDALNAEIAKVVVSLGNVFFVNPSTGFNGKGVCTSGAINGLVVEARTEGEAVTSNRVYAATLHPNVEGQMLYSDAYNQQLTALFP